jgi:T-complex protein 1 subunit delta
VFCAGDVHCCTNDAATFLQSLAISHPIGRALIQIAMAQDLQAGDGTTSVVVLAGSLCRQALLLINQRAHPMMIVSVFHRVLALAVDALNSYPTLLSSSSSSSSATHTCTTAPFDRNLLLTVARSSLASKIAVRSSSLVGDLCVDAVVATCPPATASSDPSAIECIAIQGATLCNSFLVRGVALDRPFHHLQQQSQPTSLSDPSTTTTTTTTTNANTNLVVLSFALDIDRPKTKSRVVVQTPHDLAAVTQLRTQYIEQLVRIMQQLSNVRLVICQWSIDPAVSQALWHHARIACISWVEGHTLERIALTANCAICPSLALLTDRYIGHCDSVLQLLTITCDTCRHCRC